MPRLHCDKFPVRNIFVTLQFSIEVKSKVVILFLLLNGNRKAVVNFVVGVCHLACSFLEFELVSFIIRTVQTIPALFVCSYCYID